MDQQLIGKQIVLAHILHTVEERERLGLFTGVTMPQLEKWTGMSERELEEFINVMRNTSADVLLRKTVTKVQDKGVCQDNAAMICITCSHAHTFLAMFALVDKENGGRTQNDVFKLMVDSVVRDLQAHCEKNTSNTADVLRDTVTETLLSYFENFLIAVNEALAQYDRDVVLVMLHDRYTAEELEIVRAEIRKILADNAVKGEKSRT